MTSDAKIGLLLGLVFIFVVAFIINGLPGFCNNTNNNELTRNMANSRNSQPGLAEDVRRVNREVIHPREPIQTPPPDNRDSRFTMPLPQRRSVVKEPLKAEPAALAPKVYVVGKDDHPAVIHKKVYGSEDGNKIRNITRIFETNRKVLKSPDEIYVGQKITIPPLAVPRGGGNKIDSLLRNPMLEKVNSIGRRHLSVGKAGVGQSRQHIVQEGDSLWRIAAEQLGDGSRYTEIVKLNTGILEDEDALVVGMCLKIPAR